MTETNYGQGHKHSQLICTINAAATFTAIDNARYILVRQANKIK